MDDLERQAIKRAADIAANKGLLWFDKDIWPSETQWISEGPAVFQIEPDGTRRLVLIVIPSEIDTPKGT